MTESSQRPVTARRPNHGVWIIPILALVFFGILAAILISTGKEPESATDPLEDLFVVSSALRLRTEPSLTSPVLENLERGEKLAQLASEGSWVQVRRENGTIGWAERSFLETSTDHERRMARYAAIRLLPPLQGEVERQAPLYAGPGIYYPVVGNLEPGAKVRVYTRDHDFYALEVGGDVAFAEVDSVDLSAAGAAVFEVAASDEGSEIDEPDPPLTSSLPDEMPFPIPDSDPIPTPPPPEPPGREVTVRPPGGVYPGVPAGGREPVVLDRRIPRYPPAARANGIEGTVVVRAVVRKNGRVGDVEIVRDLPFGLGEAAARAVREWRFRPATYQGEPIDVYYNVTINFRLSG